MQTSVKVTGKAVSVPKGLCCSVLGALGLTIIGVGITSKMIQQEWIAWNNIGYAVMVILLLASWLGAVIARHKIKRQKMAMCVLSGILYFGILMTITALFFGGRYSGVGETALLIICGSMLGIILKKPDRKTRKRVYSGYRHC